jgi:hypothetical protein
VNFGTVSKARAYTLFIFTNVISISFGLALWLRVSIGSTGQPRDYQGHKAGRLGRCQELFPRGRARHVAAHGRVTGIVSCQDKADWGLEFLVLDV